METNNGPGSSAVVEPIIHFCSNSNCMCCSDQLTKKIKKGCLLDLYMMGNILSGVAQNDRTKTHVICFLLHAQDGTQYFEP